MMASTRKLAEPPARTEARKLTTRIRADRATIAADITAADTATLAQLRSIVQRSLRRQLRMARMLAILTDPTSGDLVDDDAQ